MTQIISTTTVYDYQSILSMMDMILIFNGGIVLYGLYRIFKVFRG